MLVGKGVIKKFLNDTSIMAYKYDQIIVVFFIGNIVPDIISEWKEKIEVILEIERQAWCLKELANTININDDFNREFAPSIFRL